MSVILAGPWVGEFGWELLCWQAHLRRLSNEGNKIVVVSRKNRDFLYEDFCDDFIEFDPMGEETDSYRCHDMQGDFNKIYNSCKFNDYLDPRTGVVFFSNNDLKSSRNFFDQKFIQYGNGSKTEGRDIIIHARNTDKCGAHFRNWAKENWKKLVAHLKQENHSIASIGAIGSSMHIEGTDNLLGIDMGELTGIMANSRAILGPSSGPMHLASLCGLSQVVWSESKNDKKYLNFWNPFKTFVTFHSRDSWNPSIEKVIDLVSSHLKKV